MARALAGVKEKNGPKLIFEIQVAHYSQSLIPEPLEGKMSEEDVFSSSASRSLCYFASWRTCV